MNWSQWPQLDATPSIGRRSRRVSFYPFSKGYRSRSKNVNGRATKMISPGAAFTGVTRELNSRPATTPFWIRSFVSTSNGAAHPQCHNADVKWAPADKCAGARSGSVNCATPFVSVSRCRSGAEGPRRSSVWRSLRPACGGCHEVRLP